MAASSPTPSPEQSLTKPDGSASPATRDPLQGLPAPIKELLSNVPDQEARNALSILVSRTTTFGSGPDPETAKILAETEIHEEECRLKAYKATLENRDKQNERDHDFRKRKLIHQSAMTGTVMGFSGLALFVGLYLSATGNSSLGNPVAVGALAIFSTLAGKLWGKDKDYAFCSARLQLFQR